MHTIIVNVSCSECFIVHTMYDDIVYTKCSPQGMTGRQTKFGLEPLATSKLLYSSHSHIKEKSV